MAEKTTNDEKIISALLECSTVRLAAKACGISERTVYKKLENPAFYRAYNRAKKVVLTEQSARLQSGIGVAVDTMIEIMQDSEVNPSVRLKSAVAMIEQAIKTAELTMLMDRVELLEEKVMKQ